MDFHNLLVRSLLMIYLLSQGCHVKFILYFFTLEWFQTVENCLVYELELVQAYQISLIDSLC